jgi:hypothetical protein
MFQDALLIASMATDVLSAGRRRLHHLVGSNTPAIVGDQIRFFVPDLRHPHGSQQRRAALRRWQFLGWVGVTALVAAVIVGLHHAGATPAIAPGNPLPTVTPQTTKARACRSAPSLAICDSGFTVCAATAQTVVRGYLAGSGIPNLDQTAQFYADGLYGLESSNAARNQSAWTGCFSALDKRYRTLTRR